MASRWSAPELKNPSKKGDPSGAGRFAPLQAHPSMRKCWGLNGYPPKSFGLRWIILIRPQLLSGNNILIEGS